MSIPPSSTFLLAFVFSDFRICGVKFEFHFCRVGMSRRGSVSLAEPSEPSGECLTSGPAGTQAIMTLVELNWPGMPVFTGSFV